MLVPAIILTILGVIVLRWYSKGMSEPFYNRPLIFNKTISVLVINLVWVVLLAGGLYSFWKVNPNIVIFIVGIYIVLWVIGFILGSQKQKVKKLFTIYKQLKIYRPQTDKEEILKETARLYYKNLRWDESRINGTIGAIFERSVYEDRGPKSFASLILAMEETDNNFGPGHDFEKSTKKWAKKDKAIEWAYNKVFQNKEAVSQRPELTEDTIKRLRDLGLDPEVMSNEQLAALEGLDNPDKSNWLAKGLRGIGFVFGFFAIINLLNLNIASLVFNGVVAFLLIYVGYRIQVRIANKKFLEASILKWSQEQQKES